MHLGVGEILEVEFAAIAREENVVVAPEYDRPGLLLAQERLPLRVEVHVGAIIVEKVELNRRRIWPIERVQIHVPVVRTDRLWLGMAVSVDKLDGVGLQEALRAAFRSRVFGSSNRPRADHPTL